MVKTLIGVVDDPTTNPSLIAKNPEIQSCSQSTGEELLAARKCRYDAIELHYPRPLALEAAVVSSV